jgi:divalent metal cation (Fe/Co/Zn/Cd) transporter
MNAPDNTEASTRARLVRLGIRLTSITLGYNLLEGIIAVAAGLTAGSVALIGFGADSFIEVTAGGAALWRLRADLDPGRRTWVERRSRRIIGACFLGLAAYVASDALLALVRGERPAESIVGIALAMVSVVLMPMLARAKRRVAAGVQSGALRSESRQTSLCGYLSAILLGGLGLNIALGWWWADPLAALAMVPIMVHEGIEGLHDRSTCADDCH